MNIKNIVNVILAIKNKVNITKYDVNEYVKWSQFLTYSLVVDLS